MSSLLPVMALLMGAGVGLGLMLVIAGARGVAVLPGLGGGPDAGEAEGGSGDGRSRRAAGGAEGSVTPLRLVAAGGAGLLAWLISGWPALALVVAGLAVVLPRLLGGKANRKAWIARTQAIASWTEMLRDTMAAADGVEEAIAATVPIAPEAIRREVATLDARRRSEQPLPEALAAFAAEVDHPSADLVAASLSAAAQGDGSDFVAVLTRLSTMTRQEVRMRLGVEASRAKMHTSGVIIVSVVAIASAVLLLLGREYMEPYDSITGQLWLLLVGAMLVAGLLVLHRMSRITMPERFTPRRRGTGGAPGTSPPDGAAAGAGAGHRLGWGR